MLQIFILNMAKSILRLFYLSIVQLDVGLGVLYSKVKQIFMLNHKRKLNHFRNVHVKWCQKIFSSYLISLCIWILSDPVTPLCRFNYYAIILLLVFKLYIMFMSFIKVRTLTWYVLAFTSSVLRSPCPVATSMTSSTDRRRTSTMKMTNSETANAETAEISSWRKGSLIKWWSCWWRLCCSSDGGFYSRLEILYHKSIFWDFMVTATMKWPSALIEIFEIYWQHP